MLKTDADREVAFPQVAESTRSTHAAADENPKTRVFPRITIVTPSFNQGRFLEETIRSVIDQKYPNLEYIIIDGGSTDESVSIIKKYEPYLAWWVSEKDRGQSHAINKGFERATGEIMAYINSDDVLEPNALKTAAEYFRNGARWVAGSVRCFQEGKPDWLFHAVEEKCPDELLWNILFTQQGCFWSSELFRQQGPFREDMHYCFDYEYWLRLRVRAGVKPVIVPQLLAGYRWHKAAKSTKDSEHFRTEGKQLRMEYRAQLPKARRRNAARNDRTHWADVAQVDALHHLAAGRRLSASREVARSLWLWPPFAFQRRTLGLVRRILLNQGLEI